MVSPAAALRGMKHPPQQKAAQQKAYGRLRTQNVSQRAAVNGAGRAARSTTFEGAATRFRGDGASGR